MFRQAQHPIFRWKISKIRQAHSLKKLYLATKSLDMMNPITRLLFCWMIFATSFCMASDLHISNVRPVIRKGVESSPASVILDISWKNAWKNAKNHDAVWLFFKPNGGYDHLYVAKQGHRILQNRITTCPQPTFKVPEGGVGLFILLDQTYRGDVDMKVQILLAPKEQGKDTRMFKGNFSAQGLEMVYIPEGPFTLGTPDTSGIKKAAFYRSDANGEPKGLIRISSEKAIEVGPKNNALYYWSRREIYNGDQKGPVPAAFPKGHRGFYVMKYEINQGQYAAFLNALPKGWTYKRSPIGGQDYHKSRGGIWLKEGKYVAESPQRPMNFISFTDGLAYADWAGLRPITELEYTKAARGPGEPTSGEFVWGTNTYDRLERYMKDDELVLDHGWDESQLTDETRAVFGASYYWVMDLSGSVWEKVITIGNEIGRQFEGTHGDGILSFGEATNEDWPKSDDEVGGFGYRGGGYYTPDTEYSNFNPHSPIGYRFYGSWSGGPRSIAYGFRAGRTAE